MKVSLLFAIFIGIAFSITAQQVIPLYSGAAPGSEDWDWSEKEFKVGENVQFVYNVSNPTLTVFTPENPNGTAVVICPGGAFQFLSIESEGFQVAKWLNEKGITAFVLKYRLMHSLTDNPMMEMMQKQPNSEKFNKDVVPFVAMAISDGKATVAYVRTNASEFDVNPEKIGIIGFSAGGTVATGVAFTYEKINRPDFAAPIYPYVGSFEKPEVPVDAPPMFIAAASDDFFGFQDHCLKLYKEWNDAGKPAELHIYEKGGHGFGMEKKNIPTDNWIDRFYEWLSGLN